MAPIDPLNHIIGRILDSLVAYTETYIMDKIVQSMFMHDILCNSRKSPQALPKQSRSAIGKTETNENGYLHLTKLRVSKLLQ